MGTYESPARLSRLTFPAGPLKLLLVHTIAWKTIYCGRRMPPRGGRLVAGCHIGWGVEHSHHNRQGAAHRTCHRRMSNGTGPLRFWAVLGRCIVAFAIGVPNTWIRGALARDPVSVVRSSSAATALASASSKKRVRPRSRRRRLAKARGRGDAWGARSPNARRGL